MLDNAKMKALRKQIGLTQQELATKIGFSATAVKRWEIGDVQPSIRGFVALSDLFGVPWNELYMTSLLG